MGPRDSIIVSLWYYHHHHQFPLPVVWQQWMQINDSHSFRSFTKFIAGLKCPCVVIYYCLSSIVLIFCCHLLLLPLHLHVMHCIVWYSVGCHSFHVTKPSESLLGPHYTWLNVTELYTCSRIVVFNHLWFFYLYNYWKCPYVVSSYLLWFFYRAFSFFSILVRFDLYGRFLVFRACVNA